MRDLKPALTLSEQVDLLISRGMIVENHSEAERILGEKNYYRFSGYAFLFQKENNKYHKGVTFDSIVTLMNFDRDLRSILMDALELIEVYSRTKIAHVFSLVHGRNGGAYYDSSLFCNPDFHAEFLSDLELQIQKNAQQPFVAHHINNFEGRMPLWCAVEILSFSRLSKLFSNMLLADKELIAANMDTDASHLTNWLHSFSVLRNACAHYSRLYQNICSPRVSLDARFFRNHKDVMSDSLFSCILAMLRIMPREEWKAELRNSLFCLSAKYPAISFSGIGFPNDWKDIFLNTDDITLRPVSIEKKEIPHLAPLPEGGSHDC